MSGTGRVLEVVGANVPATNQPARKVLIARPDDSWTSFLIPIGCEPDVGETIGWGPHHAWWGAEKVSKLTWEIDPNAPLT